MNLLPFMDVTHERTRTLGSAHLKLFIYGAYNAFGLIGSECNGIAIVDEDRKCVVCDEIAQATTGYFGPTPHQVEELERLVVLPDGELARELLSSPRLRSISWVETNYGKEGAK